MPDDLLQGPVYLGANTRQRLEALDGTNFLLAPASDPHRHYSLSVVIPGVRVVHGVGPLHQHDGPPTGDKPIDWLTDAVCCYTVKGTDAQGRAYVEGWVENAGQNDYSATPGSFELLRVRQ